MNKHDIERIEAKLQAVTGALYPEQQRHILEKRATRLMLELQDNALQLSNLVNEPSPARRKAIEQVVKADSEQICKELGEVQLLLDILENQEF